MLSRLLEDHHRIGSIVDRIDCLLGGSRPDDLDELGRLRWTLARELIQHIALEERFLASRQRTGGLPLSRVQRVLCDHHARWTGDRIVSNWPEYRSAASKLLRVVRDRMKHEETSIFQGLE